MRSTPFAITLQIESIIAFNVWLGRIAADAFEESGR